MIEYLMNHQPRYREYWVPRYNNVLSNTHVGFHSSLKENLFDNVRQEMLDDLTKTLACDSESAILFIEGVDIQKYLFDV